MLGVCCAVAEAGCILAMLVVCHAAVKSQQSDCDNHLSKCGALCADTFDAYVATNGTVKLIDFNPVGGVTSPLLFTWQELGLEGEEGHTAAGHGQSLTTGSPTGHIDADDENSDDEESVLEGVVLRVVPAASFVQPGHRAVCSMPFDMLGLQETVDSLVARMQQQQQ